MCQTERWQVYRDFNNKLIIIIKIGKIQRPFGQLNVEGKDTLGLWWIQRESSIIDGEEMGIRLSWFLVLDSSPKGSLSYQLFYFILFSHFQVLLFFFFWVIAYKHGSHSQNRVEER